MKIKLFSLLLISVVLTACADPFADVYQLKLDAAKTIGGATGSPTVWNVESSPKIGSLYGMAGDQKHGYYLSYHGDTFEVPAKPFIHDQPDSDNWSRSINDNDNVKAQVGYMGLNASGQFSHVTAVTFSMVAQTYSEIAYDNLITALNDNDYGVLTRKAVYRDTARLVANHQDNYHAAYWVIMSITTGKSLSVSFDHNDSTSLSLDTTDVSKLASWLKVPSLVSPSISGTINPSGKTTLTSPDTFSFVVQCYPLVAYLDGPNKGQIYIDQSIVLVSANTLRP